MVEEELKSSPQSDFKLPTYSGKEFNEKYHGTKFYKTLNKRENHNKFQFQTGLNIDPIPINLHKTCCPGGIYFCTENYIYKWLLYDLRRQTGLTTRSPSVSDDQNKMMYIEKLLFQMMPLFVKKRINSKRTKSFWVKGPKFGVIMICA